jgi:hypothetical protein
MDMFTSASSAFKNMTCNECVVRRLWGALAGILEVWDERNRLKGGREREDIKYRGCDDVKSDMVSTALRQEMVRICWPWAKEILETQLQDMH